MSFFTELKRRNVFRMGIAYVVVAWVLLQAIDFTLDIISAPNWVMQVFFLAAVAGLPVVLIFSWVFEMTPEGIKLESQIDRSESVTHNTSRKLDRTIITFLAFAVVLLLGERFMTKEEVPLAAKPAEAAVAKAEIIDPATVNSARSVAVLPFVNMSSDPEQEYFSDGLSEELLNRLAQNSRLHVAARTSSFQFKGQNLDVAEIGRQLKVENILEGSVRKSANRLRITAQLIRVDTGFHLWSETYEREMDDVFAIQDDIALAITTALEAELGTASASTRPTDNIEAYQAYLQARFFLAKRGEANMLKAHTLFERSVSLDPTFSKAWSGLAYNYSLLPGYGPTVTYKQAWETVKIATERAIGLDLDNAEAYVALARSNYEDDFKTILGLYEKAYELAPNNADVVNFYADFMMNLGDFDAAERLEKIAIDLDPLAAVHYSDLAFVMFPLGRFAEGLDYGRTSARLEPDVPWRSDALVVGLIVNGQYDEAIQIIKQFEQQPDPEHFMIDWWWNFLYLQQGDEQGLRERLAGINQRAETQGADIDYALMAFFTAWLDGTDAALPILEIAYETDEGNLYWPEYFYLPEDISDDPDWLAFWQQPRLAELMEIRRSNKTRDHIGWWKERPAQ